MVACHDLSSCSDTGVISISVYSAFVSECFGSICPDARYFGESLINILALTSASMVSFAVEYRLSQSQRFFPVGKMHVHLIVAGYPSEYGFMLSFLRHQLTNVCH